MLLAGVPAIGLALALASTLAAGPGTGYVSVPAAAFRPGSNAHDYFNTGWSAGAGVLTGSALLFAPVQLPHGATVTKVTLYFYDGDTSDELTVELFRSDHDQSPNSMAVVNSVNPGSSEYDDSINYATIDNSLYSYYMKLTARSTSMWLNSVIIEYTFPTATLPFVARGFSAAPRMR
jgi:hypothetical protein